MQHLTVSQKSIIFYIYSFLSPIVTMHTPLLKYGTFEAMPTLTGKCCTLNVNVELLSSNSKNLLFYNDFNVISKTLI